MKIILYLLITAQTILFIHGISISIEEGLINSILLLIINPIGIFIELRTIKRINDENK